MMPASPTWSTASRDGVEHYTPSDRLSFILTAEDAEINMPESARGKLVGHRSSAAKAAQARGAARGADVPILGTTPDAIDLPWDRATASPGCCTGSLR
jgi:hypothetical protein